MITILFWLMLGPLASMRGRLEEPPPPVTTQATVAVDGVRYRYLCRGNTCDLIATQPLNRR